MITIDKKYQPCTLFDSLIYFSQSNCQQIHSVVKIKFIFREIILLSDGQKDKFIALDRWFKTAQGQRVGQAFCKKLNQWEEPFKGGHFLQLVLWEIILGGHYLIIIING